MSDENTQKSSPCARVFPKACGELFFDFMPILSGGIIACPALIGELRRQCTAARIGNSAPLFCVCRHSRFGAISSDCIYIDIFSRAKIE